MMRSLVFIGLLSSACALRGMRTRDADPNFLDLFDAAVEDREVTKKAAHLKEVPSKAFKGGAIASNFAKKAPDNVMAKKGDPDSDYGYGYYDPTAGGDSSSGSPYYYGGDGYYGGWGGQDSNPGIVDKEWQRPWNIINNACSNKNFGEKSNMEIVSVGGGAYYLGVIDIGTPSQPLNMILDTGSDEIVIKGKGCQGCSGYAYDFEESKTGVKDEYGPNKGLSAFAYGSGPVTCQRVNDTVRMGEFEGKGMGMQMIIETSISFFQQDDKTSLHAIVGMAPGMPEYVGNTLASNMEVRTFSECLPKNGEENGFFVINDDRPAVKEQQGFEGPFKGVGVYYWAVATTGLRFEWDWAQAKYNNTKTIPLYDPNKTIVAIVDTGTSLLSMPSSVMDALNQALEDLDFDCSRMGELPDMKFEIEGVMHKLSPEDYVAISDGSGYALHASNPGRGVQTNHLGDQTNNLGDNSAMNKLFFHKPGKRQFLNTKTGQQCMLLFTDPLNQESDEGEMAILGMPFFREYEISFDFCTKEMYTKKSHGDCSTIVGQRPSNVQFCTDKNWFMCWLQGFADFFTGFWDGLVNIFNPEATPKVDKDKKTVKSSSSAAALGKTMLNRRKNLQPNLALKPQDLRLSSAAHSMLQLSSGNGIVSI